MGATARRLPPARVANHARRPAEIEADLRDVQDKLSQAHDGPLYFPFAFSDKRPMRTTQGYLVKFPAALVQAIPQLAEAVSGSATPAFAEGPDDDPAQPAVSDGRIADPALRRAVEIHAVDTVIAHLTELGWRCEDVGAWRSYDIYGVRGDEELHAEVKGSLSERLAVDLTEGEVGHARTWANTLLAVVDGVEWTIDLDGRPQASGGRMRQWWNWEPDTASLVPTRYRHILPEGGESPAPGGGETA